MKNMTLESIARACNGQLYNHKSSRGTVQGVVIDSRQVEEGYVFIATRGEQVDGHSYIAKAHELGAIGVICEEVPVGIDISYILVSDSFLALKQVATYYREQLEIPMIAIVGSVGKTSTKEMIATVLEESYCVLKTQGNYNNEIGLPLTILRIRSEHEVAVLELGINQFGEMDRLGNIAKPNYVVMTNIGECHLEYLESREGILRAKSEVLAHVKSGGRVFVNGDDPYLAKVHGTERYGVDSYGLQEENTIYGTQLQCMGLRGTKAGFVIEDRVMDVTIPIAGEHMVYNALAAAAVANELGLSREQMQQGIGNAKTIGGRGHLCFVGQRIIIDDCYNANPVSMKAAIDLLMLSDTRKVAILGDMGELGEDEKHMHASVGEYAARSGIEVCVCVGQLSKYMADSAKEFIMVEHAMNGCEILWFQSVEELLLDMNTFLEESDTILVKASHSMEFDKIVKALV